MNTGRRVSAASAAISVLLAALMLFSCSGGAPEPTEAPQTSETPATEPAPAELEVVKDGKTDFKVIRPDEAGGAVTEGSVALRKRLNFVTGADIGIGTDWLAPTAEPEGGRHEITVGSCDRADTRDFIEGLGDNEYGFRVYENKIVIAGGSDSLTALALYSFENQVIYNKEFAVKGSFSIPVGTERIYRTDGEMTRSKVLNSSYTVMASTGAAWSIPTSGAFRTGQGAATDGKYFYNCLLNKDESGSQTDVIVRTSVEDKSDRKVSAALPLHHGNDIAYDSTRRRLVVATMDGKKLAVVDPDTLELKQTVEATGLPGTAYAIAYLASKDVFVIAAGGVLNITDAEFKVKSTLPIHSETDYVGQGMDCDDEFIYLPLSGDGTKTKDNIISVYKWDTGYFRTVHLATRTESESLMNWEGRYYINFNTGGARINELFYDIVYQ